MLSGDSRFDYVDRLISDLAFINRFSKQMENFTGQKYPEELPQFYGLLQQDDTFIGVVCEDATDRGINFISQLNSGSDLPFPLKTAIANTVQLRSSILNFFEDSARAVFKDRTDAYRVLDFDHNMDFDPELFRPYVEPLTLKL